MRPYRNKLFALSIAPERLHQIRQERRPDSRYAKLETCKREVAAAEALFRAERIPVLSTTHKSIEEIASTVLKTDRESVVEGKSVSVRGGLGGRRVIKTKM